MRAQELRINQFCSTAFRYEEGVPNTLPHQDASEDGTSNLQIRLTCMTFELNLATMY